MATLIESVSNAITEEPASSPRPPAASGPASVMAPWLRAQSINVTRHAAALRPFLPDEFGVGAEAPTAGHLQAVNKLMNGLRSGLLRMSGQVRKAGEATSEHL